MRYEKAIVLIYSAIFNSERTIEEGIMMRKWMKKACAALEKKKVRKKEKLKYLKCCK